MAGAGWRAFTRQILSSAQVQTYLMDQAVLKYASAAARAAEVTSPAAGMTSWLTDSRLLESHNGSAWECPYALGTIGEGAVAAPSSIVTSSTRTRITGNLNITVSLTAGRLYRAQWLCGLIADAASTPAEATVSIRGAGTPADTDPVVACGRHAPALTGTAGAGFPVISGQLFTVAASGSYQVSPWIRRTAGAGGVQAIEVPYMAVQAVQVRDEGLLSRRDWLNTVNKSTVLTI